MYGQYLFKHVFLIVYYFKSNGNTQSIPILIGYKYEEDIENNYKNYTYLGGNLITIHIFRVKIKPKVKKIACNLNTNEDI